MSGRPLAGKSVVVTRPAEQANDLCAFLTERGGIPVRFPTIHLRPVDNAGPLERVIGHLPEYDWVVFTSVNAVRFFCDRLPVRGEAAWPAGVRVAAVGPATASRLGSLGIPVAVVPGTYRGEEIPASLGRVAGRRILLPRADIGREETIAALRAAGAAVEAITVYHTVPAAPDPGGLASLRAGVHALTFTSPSTLENFRLLLGPEAEGVAAGRVVATIGPSTSEAVRQAGWPEPVEAAVATTEGLVMALEDHFSHAPATRPRDER